MADHDHKTTRSSWYNMHCRCKSDMAQYYSRYKAKGIKVCKEWKTFDGFLQEMGERPLGKELFRKNTSKDYSKGNCFWDVPQNRAVHRGNVEQVTVNGETMTMVGWAGRLGVTKTTVYYHKKLQGSAVKAVKHLMAKRSASEACPIETKSALSACAS